MLSSMLLSPLLLLLLLPLWIRLALDWAPLDNQMHHHRIRRVSKFLVCSQIKYVISSVDFSMVPLKILILFLPLLAVL